MIESGIKFSSMLNQPAAPEASQAGSRLERSTQARNGEKLAGKISGKSSKPETSFREMLAEGSEPESKSDLKSEIRSNSMKKTSRAPAARASKPMGQDAVNGAWVQQPNSYQSRDLDEIQVGEPTTVDSNESTEIKLGEDLAPLTDAAKSAPTFGRDVKRVLPDTMAPLNPNVLGQAIVEQAQNKQDAMEKFLGRMQQEFGKTPADVLQAFSNLDQATLAGPPEAAQAAFVEQLGLSEAQAPRAEQLYSLVVKDIGRANDNLSQLAVGQVPQNDINVQVMTKREAAMKQINNSVDMLNDIFADRVQYMTDQGPVAARTMNPEELNSRVMQLMQNSGKDTKKSDDETEAFSTAALGAGLAGLASASSSSTSVPTDLPGQAINAENPLQFADMVTPKFGSPAATTAKSSLDLGKAGKGIGDKAEAAELSDMKATTALPLAALMTEFGSVKNEFATTLNQAFPASPQQVQANMQEIVNQAQVILKNGGGEMTVQMKPEGLGNVNLKISVEQGQVNVQMLTDSAEGKKILEKGLDDLKSQLSAHKINLESLKVDMSPDIKKDLNLANQNQQHQADQNRAAIQDYLSSQREDRQAWRQNFFGRGGYSGSGREQRRAEVQPAQTIAAAQAAAAKAQSAGDRRLNVVA